MYSIVTFNILANVFTNFSLGNDDKKESKNNMNIRYKNILEKLYKFHLNRDVDFICLQEVDCVFYKLLKEDKNIIKYFEPVYNAMRLPNDYVNSSDYDIYTYGLLTLVNKKKHKIKNKKTIEISSRELLNSERRKNSRISQIIEIKNGIKIANTHLTGIPERTDMRLYEINTILDEGVDFVCGDFNEPNYGIIKKEIKEKNMTFYEEYFKNKKFATSHHKWNLDQKTKKYYLEPPEEKYKSVDYILYPYNYQLVTHDILPNKKNGVFGMDTPFGKKTDWFSDHALIYIKIIKNENNNNIDNYNGYLLKKIDINNKIVLKKIVENKDLKKYVKKGRTLLEIIKNNKKQNER
jgi:endonuclease/exonuclease/phosphatase family metal-dependent hydrolase